MRKYFIWILGVIGAVLAIIGLFFDEPELRMIFVILGALIIIEGIVINIFFKRFATTILIINDDGVSFSNNKRNIVFRFNEIKKINTTSVSNLGGFITIVGNNGEKIKLTVVIKNIGDFVLTLRKKLDELGLDVYNKDKLFKFYKTACYSDDSWRRVYYAFPEIILYTILIIAISNLSLIYYSNLAVSMIYLSIVPALIIYTAVELGFYRRIIRKKADPITWGVTSFDLIKEKRFIKYILRIPVALIIITFIFEFISSNFL